jgi:hypothetical protein
MRRYRDHRTPRATEERRKSANFLEKSGDCSHFQFLLWPRPIGKALYPLNNLESGTRLCPLGVLKLNTRSQPLAVSASIFGALPTCPMPIGDYAPQVRIGMHLAVVDQHHPRVAKAIEAIWGSPECGEYLSKLILNGCEGAAYSRMGFKPQVVSALMQLFELHETRWLN